MLNVLCHYYGDLGVHTLGREFVAALQAYDEVVVLPLELITRFLPPPVAPSEENTGIGLGAPDLAGMIVGRPRILHTVWETTKLDASRKAYLAKADEIWTASSWGKEILERNAIPKDKVHVVPEGVNAVRFQPSPPIHASSQRPFRFLCVGKWEVRKGIDVLIRAFAAEFDPAEPVELLLHCHNPHIPNFDAGRMLAKFDLRPGSRIRVSSPIDQFELVKLYNSCDAFVLPTRGEGWGLPIIEAMACAKPVIVTEYSAHLDYVTSDEGYLIRVARMIDVQDPDFFDPAIDFGQWAEPDAEHLQMLMRHVVRNPEEAREKGWRARESVAASWTWENAAAVAWRRLQARRGITA